jgi:chemotaxis protein CheC
MPMMMDDAAGPEEGLDRSRLLGVIFERGAEAASEALSRWLGRRIRLIVSAIETRDVSEAAGLLGPEDALVASCVMPMSGELSGELLLVFDDVSGLALADLLLGRAAGTSNEWGELEQSAALETANIVGCALLNSLAAHWPGAARGAGERPSAMAPGPPRFRHEFAASLLEFAVMDQATAADRVLVVRSRFATESEDLRWWLLLVPDAATMRALSGAGGGLP